MALGQWFKAVRPEVTVMLLDFPRWLSKMTAVAPTITSFCPGRSHTRKKKEEKKADGV